MIKIENYEVLGWEHAIRGMRNPMNSWEKSDSLWANGWVSDRNVAVQYAGEYDEYQIGPNDQALMKKLANAGPVHGKFRRMITVYVDITAPLYWWKEFDTYKVGTVANSCSTMHKLPDKEFGLCDFSVEHLLGVFDEKGKDTGLLLDVSALQDGSECFSPRGILNNTVTMLNICRDAYLRTKKKVKNANDSDEAKRLEALAKKYWWQMIQLLPSSYNQKRTVQLNYEVLANMYEYRKAHKLDEWREFCEWIKKLPYSEIITAGIPATIEPEPAFTAYVTGPNGIVRPQEDIEKYGNSVRGE